jgi:hypothetical protein
MPFLALSGKHGYNINLNNVKHGIGINMRDLNRIELAKDGKTATIGGGIVTKRLTHELWEMGKITSASLTPISSSAMTYMIFYAATGCCECTGSAAPMLGGGHGWLQGQYGLMADNLVSARLVLANGSAITVSDTEHADLFWALKGAGHNFGIVTSFEYKIYDRARDNENFALETLIFTGDKLEEVFKEANKMLLDRPVELMWFAMLFPMPDVDPVKVRRGTFRDVGALAANASSPSSSSFLFGKAPQFPPNGASRLQTLRPLPTPMPTPTYSGWQQ